MKIDFKAKRPTYEERQWHRHYTRLPLYIDQTLVWFDWVERRATMAIGGSSFWSYRLPEDQA